MATRGDANLARQKLAKTLQCGRGYEYLWNAAWCFYPERPPAAEKWVHRHAMLVLEGHARKVAGMIRRRATKAHLEPAQRKSADDAANYLTNNRRYVDYPTALEHGWPIATGIIEGRHDTLPISMGSRRRSGSRARGTR